MESKYQVGDILKSGSGLHAVVLMASPFNETVAPCDPSGQYYRLTSKGELYVAHLGVNKEYEVVGSVDHEHFVGLISAWRKSGVSQAGVYLPEFEKSRMDQSTFTNFFGSRHGKEELPVRPLEIQIAILSIAENIEENGYRCRCEIMADGYKKWSIEFYSPTRETSKVTSIASDIAREAIEKSRQAPESA